MDKYNDAMALAEKFEEGYKAGVYDTKKTLSKQNMESYDKIKKVLALGFMNFLDGNKSKGKMCLSNGECEDIEKAFNEQDWAKLTRYLDKYISHNKIEKTIAGVFVKYGMDSMKEQMLKEAVEGEVVKDINNKLAVTAKNVNLDKFKFGDKVCVIVLPKED